MTQLQLIQRLGQIWFNDDPQNFETQLAHWRDLVYQIDNIGRIDASRLGLLYLFQNLKVSHPTVHDALAPAIMDGSMTEEMFVLRMRYYFEMRAAQAAQTYIGGQPGLDVALPAFTPRGCLQQLQERGSHFRVLRRARGETCRPIYLRGNHAPTRLSRQQTKERRTSRQ
ncbi:hypothetical protein BJV78DRAFT_301871 [Lactifluus subvellereus]|nr:hypothetical protein BJV78DRAFT_301871 [Lactifluus subvellereus]